MNRVAQHVFIGSWVDAHVADPVLERVCVYEGEAPVVRGGAKVHHVPIMVGYKQADPVALDAVAALIEERLAAGAMVLVHCMMGIERSALALAWWMRSSGRAPSLEAAYVVLKAARPLVQDRRSWLPEQVR